MFWKGGISLDSIVLYTEEIDDLQEAVEELFTQAGKFSLKKNTLAVLFAEEDTDYPELYKLLSTRWDFPVIGSTTMAMLLAEQGCCRTGISILLLTADDCSFAVGMTDDLNKDHYREEITNLCASLRQELPAPPKLALTYGGMVASEENVPGDEVVSVMEETLGKDVPVYGGIASDGFSFNNYRVFCEGRTTQSGQAIALVSGNIDPIFITTNSVENRADVTYEVTKAQSNKVMRLGNGTFIDALRRENMEVSKQNVVGDYFLSPFVLSIDLGDGDVSEITRTLSLLNLETGTGIFLGEVPEGSILRIGILNRKDVQKSVEQAFGEILATLSKSDGRRRTLLCHSCAARFLAMASNTKAEAETYQSRLPEGFSLLGMYGNGEFCPLYGDKTGKNHNFFHNFTFTIMAI